MNSSSLLISLPFPSFRRFTKTRRGLRFGDVRSASIFQECEQANRQRSHLPRVCSREGVRRRRRVCHYFPWTCIPVSFWYLIFMQLWINRWFMQQGKDVALFSHLYHDLYSFPRSNNAKYSSKFMQNILVWFPFFEWIFLIWLCMRYDRQPLRGFSYCVSCH